MTASSSHSYQPISAYALLSDCHSAALVSRGGSVDWCCFPRFDSRPVFARILDHERGGHFSVAPVTGFTVERIYQPGTNVLETRFRTDGGTMVLTDCLVVGPEARGRDGAASVLSPHQLLRRIQVESGTVEVLVDFEPRFDYGMTTPRLEMTDPHVGVAYGGADGLLLQSDLPLRQTSDAGCGTNARMRAGEEAWLAVSYRRPHTLRAHRLSGRELDQRLEATSRFWRAWSDICEYAGPYRDRVLRSALVLKALTYAPTGAIIAAPTTSLPEIIGGVRNWDYRFAWLRDAALNLSALFTLGYHTEAHAFMDWVKHTTAGRAAELQIMYGVGGERLLPEVELSDVDGHRGSCPVRIGNAAAQQKQHDVYGFLLDLAWLYLRYEGSIEPTFWDLLRGAANQVTKVWSAPDPGIWEMRDAPRDLVLSKVMCWTAMDRAVRLATRLKLPAEVNHWREVRDEIRNSVMREGVNPATGGFVQAYGSDAVDSSNLMLPLVGFLPATDPRMRVTVAEVERQLGTDGLVRRYVRSDGLPGEDPAFVICGFWLVQNLALAGELDRAETIFEGICAHANDVGLLSEEIHPVSGELLGNFPQAFSHVGLIGSAMNLYWARTGSRVGRPPRSR